MIEAEPAGLEPSSFFTRLLTAFVYAVVCLVCVGLGNRWLALPALCVVFALIGSDELYRIAAPGMAKMPRLIGFILAVSLPVITVIARLNIPENPVIKAGGLAALTALFYSILIALLGYLSSVAVTPTSHVRDAAVSFFGALYLGMPLSCLILIREMNTGLVLTLATMTSIWAADSFAYVGGSLFGRHKLAPVISPKKSWEGLFFATLGSILMWYVVPLIFMGHTSLIAALVLGTVVSFSSLAGDLFESRIKRDVGVKDSGSLLPGHGGILDRIDSLLFTSTLVFIILSLAGALLGVVGI